MLSGATHYKLSKTCLHNIYLTSDSVSALYMYMYSHVFDPVCIINKSQCLYLIIAGLSLENVIGV